MGGCRVRAKGCGTAFHGAGKASPTTKAVLLNLQNVLREAEAVIPPGPMDFVTQGHRSPGPRQGTHSGMCPSARFLLAVERDSLFLAARARRQEENQDHPHQTTKAPLCCVPAVSHMWMQAALSTAASPSSVVSIPRPVNARQARGLAAEVKGHFIFVTFSSANENVSPACPREGFLQLQPSCD